jgi:transcriptional regulator with GAF, ATPase, and Fis domain
MAAAHDRVLGNLRSSSPGDCNGSTRLVRELAHVIERAVILTDGRELRVRQALALARPRPGRSTTGSRTTTPAAAVTDAEMRRLEQENIQLAMDEAGGKIYGHGGAAERLGLKPTTLTYRMKALGIRPR